MSILSAALEGWDHRRLIAAAQFAGLQGIEWAMGPGQVVTNDSSDRYLHALAGELSDAGLEAPALSIQDPRVTLARPERLQRAIESALCLGVKRVRVHAPQWHGEDSNVLSECIGSCAAALEEGGLELLLEVSPGTLLPSPELIRAMIARHPARMIGTLYDPGNMVIEGHLAPELAVRLLGPVLKHVHVKNVVWEYTGGHWAWRHTGLRAGLVEWRDVFSALAHVGYKDWLSLDHLDGPGDEVLLKRFADDARALAGQLRFDGAQ